MAERSPVLAADRILALEQDMRPRGVTANAGTASAKPCQVGDCAGIEIANQKTCALSPARTVRTQVQSEQKSSLLNQRKHLIKIPKPTRARVLDNAW